jgi:excisionase family DNA binding protein
MPGDRRDVPDLSMAPGDTSYWEAGRMPAGCPADATAGSADAGRPIPAEPGSLLRACTTSRHDVPEHLPQRGYTPGELARLLRVSPDRIRAWIARGELAAVNTADVRCGKRRYVILPHQLAAWVQSRLAGPPPTPPRRRKPRQLIDYYPD